MIAAETMADRGTRSRFQGVWEIARFNWSRYAAAGAVVIGALGVAAISRSGRVTSVALIACAPPVFWSIASLLVSYHVYDGARVLDARHALGGLPRSPRSWINIHAGLDETTAGLAEALPGTAHETLDIFDPSLTPEPSIRRARRGRPGHAIPADPRALPISDATCDAVFLLFAAHELRRPGVREAFFREVERVLGPGGRVVLHEHLRDAANFAAFGPGVFHFIPRREWLRVAKLAGFEVETERRTTAFTRLFVLRKNV